MTAACIICGGAIPPGPNHTTRKTCSDACRLRLNAMRKRANRHAARERKLEAAGPRVCAECNAPIPWERNLHCNTCSDTCRTNRDRRQMREREQKKRAERAAAPVRTVRVKVTYPKTGVTRWENRPLVPWTVSKAQDYARRNGALKQARKDAEAVDAVLGQQQDLLSLVGRGRNLV